MLAKDFRKQAWESLRGNWVPAILACLIYGAIIGIASLIPVGSLLIYGLMMVGISGVMITLMRTKEVKIENVFDGFKEGTLNNLITGLLYNVFLALWTMLFFIPGLVKSYSYAMTFYIQKENPEMSGTEAITKSRAMMHGNKWRLFCLDFSFVGWYLLSALTCGVLMIWVLPYHMAAHAAFYEEIKNA